MPSPYFQEIKTRRLNVGLKELTTGKAIELASLPVAQNQLAIRHLLSSVIHPIDGIGVKALTVQEQLLIFCQYVSAVSPHPDFELSHNAHYSDYLAAETDVALDDETGDLKTFSVGDVGGDHWQIRYLTGGMAESIERLLGEVKLPNGDAISPLAHWELGCMAAMLFTDDIPALDSGNEGLFDEQLVLRMTVFLNYPQSIYSDLRSAFYYGLTQINHLFHIGFSDKGIVVFPKEDGSALPAARFRVSTILTDAAKTLARRD